MIASTTRLHVRSAKAAYLHASAAALPRVRCLLVDAFRGDVAPLPAPPEHVRAHRWRYAFVDNPLDEGCLVDRDARLGVCGDWCLQGDVEGAWRSGVLLAGRLVGGLGTGSEPAWNGP